jgi:hypothetical protein
MSVLVTICHATCLYSVKNILSVRHILNRQMYRREGLCVQQDLLYGDFRSHRIFKIDSSKFLSRDRLWLWTGFGLMTRFIGHFDTVHDYTLQFTITTNTQAQTSVHSHVFTAVAW